MRPIFGDEDGVFSLAMLYLFAYDPGDGDRDMEIAQAAGAAAAMHGARRMKRVAVFGNAGGGKSTLARQLAELTGLPLYVVDMMEFAPGGAAVPRDEYLRAH